MELATVRQMWQLIEPVHALVYYAPELTEEVAALGLPTGERWPGYFALRSAPLGAAGPNLVAATYYSFSPRMVAEYVPAVWATADPAKVLDARLSGVDRALRALLGDRVESAELAEAATLALRAVRAADLAGRPLAAANADLPWPDAPHLALWQAVTILREHRGDGHLTVLRTAGLDPAESLVSFAAVGAAPVEVFASRRWTAEEWNAARDRLAARDLVDGDGVATDAGRRLRDEVERRTDELAAAPWRALGPAVGRFAKLVAPLTAAVVATGLLPARSTLGIRRPQ
ncbi:SCO6745 family protein [Micromonospora chersina]|uniref:SCO6745 family protein n=1 Tax=Micromonospora chersina TaxID=47854 RepID=UPI00371D3261